MLITMEILLADGFETIRDKPSVCGWDRGTDDVDAEIVNDGMLLRTRTTTPSRGCGMASDDDGMASFTNIIFERVCHGI
jgi:hypothetical protein